ncbi:MAG: hypothetical protein HGB19_01430 [Chlorobiales bacterium]|nr:hypothetical protein [Chlorobiales bacterium]
MVTLEDHFLTGGLFSIVAELLVQQPMKVNLLPFALKEKWFKPALLPDVLKQDCFTDKQIAERILAHVRDIKYSVL